MLELLTCASCGTQIGVVDEVYCTWAAIRKGKPVTSLERNCFGEKSHAKLVISQNLRFFGWLKRLHVFYSETVTSQTLFIYTGPRSRIALWLAIHLGTRGRGWDLVYSVLRVGYGRSYPPREVFVAGLRAVVPDGPFGIRFQKSDLERFNLEAS